MRNITFKNIHVSHLDQMAIAISTWYGSGSTLVENVSYTDIFMDGEQEYPVPQCESPEHPEYIPQTGFVPWLVNIHAMKLGKYTGNQGYAAAEDLSGFHLRYRNIGFKNVRYTGRPLKVEVQPIPEVLCIENIRVENSDFTL